MGNAAEVLETYLTFIVNVFASVFDSANVLQVYYLLLLPFRYVYIRGPQIKGVGFWQGINPEDICSTLSSVPASHWSKHTGECDSLIDRKVEAFFIGVMLMFCGLALYWVVHYYMYVKSMERIMSSTQLTQPVTK